MAESRFGPGGELFGLAGGCISLVEDCFDLAGELFGLTGADMPWRGNEFHRQETELRCPETRSTILTQREP